MSIQALPYITLLAFLFGSTLIASRFSVGQYHPTTYIGLRLVLASLGHLAVYALWRRAWPRDKRLWWHATVLGVLGTAVPMTGIVSSLQYLSSGLASVLITTNPAITVVMAHFFLADEKLNRRKTAGVLLALGGAFLLAVRGESGLPDVSQANPLGYVLVLTAMLFGSGATIYARKYMQHMDSFDVASVRMFAAALVVMPLSVLFFGFDMTAVTPTGYFALGYASLVGTFLGMLLAFYNIKRFGATASAMTAYIIPIVAGLGGVLFLGERVTAGMLLGVGLIVAGIWLINRRETAVVPVPENPTAGD
ncbi:MAG: DMT family transporter [Chloroflexi bacterium]|nr:MAG: DMT family transporter [Chloroflexota bacterium]